MVLALLAGRKTQTRRLVKPQPEFTEPGTKFIRGNVGHSGPGWYAFHEEYPEEGSEHWRSYADVGDRLWGRETFVYREKHDRYYYRADHPKFDPYAHNGWRPSIFMPRRASRLLHEVTAVRVERLQDISEADAIAEGLVQLDPNGFDGDPMWGCQGVFSADFADPRAAYRELWESINGPESWAANPWVWVVSFRKVES